MGSSNKDCSCCYICSDLCQLLTRLCFAAASRAYTPESITIELDDESVPDQMKVFDRTASFLLHMLQKHPLSSHTITPAPASDRHLAQPAVGLASNAPAAAPEQPQGTTALQAVGQMKQLDDSVESVPTWPTPPAAAWAEIQTIANRAFVTLHWATLFALPEKERPEDPDLSPEEAERLFTRLIAVSHETVSGHILDPALDMDKLFWTAFAPVMHCWLIFGCVSLPQTEIGLALLHRMVRDKGLISHAEGASETRCHCGNMNPSWMSLLLSVVLCESHWRSCHEVHKLSDV